MTEPERKAWLEGQEAVRRRPLYTPDNPYDEVMQKVLFEAWDEGAYSAGVTEIYNNGRLKKSEQ
jgi:hypothetical protein